MNNIENFALDVNDLRFQLTDERLRGSNQSIFAKPNYFSHSSSGKSSQNAVHTHKMLIKCVALAFSPAMKLQ